MKTRSAIIISLSLLLFLVLGCEQYEEDPDFPSIDLISQGKYLGDYWPTNGWRMCAPKEVGMDDKKLRELNEEIILLKKLHIDIHGILIVKDGYIVAEQNYSEDYGNDSLHPIASCTKSVTSALYGIALGKGYLESLDQKMVGFFPGDEVQNMTEEKKDITLEHLLTMSSGLEWYEDEYPYRDERNTYRQWINQGGGIQFVLDRPMVATPGEEYSYNTGGSHVLSGILQKITGTRADSFAMEYLFAPLGIEKFYWPVDGNGVAFGGSAMRLAPRDMARLGYLFLRNGQWDGSQIIPEEWVYESQQPRIQRKYVPGYHYGYHWWISDHDFYAAVGYGGQRITVFPDLDLVVIFTNGLDEANDLQRATPDRLIETYILPSIL